MHSSILIVAGKSKADQQTVTSSDHQGDRDGRHDELDC